MKIPQNLAAMRLRASAERPYFRSSLVSLVPCETPGLDTFAVDEWYRLYYDPIVLTVWTVEEGAWALIHEISHLLRDHPARARSSSADPQQWNVAADLEINDDMVSEGAKLPGQPLVPSLFGWPDGETAEQYMARLRKKVEDEREKRRQAAQQQQQQQPQPGQQPGQQGQPQPGDGEGDDAQQGGQSKPQDGDGSESQQGGDTQGSGQPGDEGDGQGQGQDQGQDGQDGAGGAQGGEGESEGQGQGEGGTGDGQGAEAGQSGGGQGQGQGDGQPGSGNGQGQGQPSDNAPASAAGGGPGSGESQEKATADTAKGRCGSAATGKREPWESGKPDPKDDTSPPGLNKGEQNLVRRHVAKEIQEAAKSRGTVPGSWKSWAEEVLNPRVPWEKILSGAVRGGVAEAMGMVDYTYSFPSRRQYVCPQVIMPALRAPTPNVKMVVDTSGSMSDKDLGEAFGQVAAVVKRCGGRRGIEVLAVDARVAACKRVMNKRGLKDLCVGRGGTDMRIGIKAALAKNKPNVIVVLTDGYTPWPDHAIPGVKVIAVLIGTSSDTTPDWIKSITLDDYKRAS